MEEGQELVAGLTLRQLMVISSILYFYERHIWHFATPTPKRTKQLIEIQMLLVKMPLLATSKIGVFTPSEVGYIEAAIETFMKQAREKLPQSESRDAVIESCQLPPAKARGLESVLHRNSEYRRRRSALVSMHDPSGHTDKVPVLIQSCRMRSVRIVTFLAPTKSAWSV